MIPVHTESQESGIRTLIDEVYSIGVRYIFTNNTNNITFCRITTRFMAHFTQVLQISSSASDIADPGRVFNPMEKYISQKHKNITQHIS